MSDAPQMRAALVELAAGRDLEQAAMAEVFRELIAGACDPAQVGALLMGLAQKGETMAELAGAARAMREAVVAVPTQRSPLLDTCGTGGSGIPRRNVSTAVAICVAACGVAVAKHGNRGASSRSGSADVLEVLGVRLDASASAVGRCIDEVGVGFLFAPALHPAMQHAMGPRRALGVRTIFNLLGPLTNPAGARRQLLGVYDPTRCEALAGALGALGSERVLVVHGFSHGVTAGPDATPGIDDVSPEGETWVAEWRAGDLHRYVVSPRDAGLDPVPIAGLAGESPAQNAEALLRLLEGEPGPYRTAVQLSGAMALLAAGDGTLRDLPRLAQRIGAVLDDGSARSKLAELASASHHEGP
jgi:anthranilate phosphoribosyltransferase